MEGHLELRSKEKNFFIYPKIYKNNPTKVHQISYKVDKVDWKPGCTKDDYHCNQHSKKNKHSHT